MRIKLASGYEFGHITLNLLNLFNLDLLLRVPNRHFVTVLFVCSSHVEEIKNIIIKNLIIIIINYLRC